MSKSPLADLLTHGQSFWYDNIQRRMIESGELDKMISDDGLRGITSNPTIFEKAIAGSNDYDQALASSLQDEPLASARDHFFNLAVDDIRQAADKLLPVYEQSKAVDGYVSLEVSPDLAHDTEGSINEGKRLFLRLNRPNVMIKVPATKAGIPVIEQLIADGVNVNATLLFSVERYVEVAKAYLRGLQKRKDKGHRVDNIASVASFFISRVDAAFDKALADVSGGDQYLGQVAMINAKRAYSEYEKLFGDSFADLKAAGAQPQRLLWASTGVKNPDYSDVLYIEELIAPDTVNTIPPATADAFRDHGKAAANTLQKGSAEAEQNYAAVLKLGVNADKIMQKLEDDGVQSFAKSFETLLKAIDDKVTAIKENRSSSAA